MKHFVLAVTTFNRFHLLKRCLESWNSTRSETVKWTLLIADDGSNDGTIEYLEQLKGDFDIKIISNYRMGIHQQMNTIIEFLEKVDFDFCFKIDDDIEFLSAGWDNEYYQKAMKSGFHHLIFFEKKWSTEQHFETPIQFNEFESNVAAINVHGFFYTLTKDVIEKVGYFDHHQFGFRGMGHVDYSIRCCKAGFNNLDTPFDIANSQKYISAYSEDYKPSLNSNYIKYYDSYHRKKKEDVIKNSSIYKPLQAYIPDANTRFKEDLNQALLATILENEKRFQETINWYEAEFQKIKDYYSTYTPSIKGSLKKITKKLTGK